MNNKPLIIWEKWKDPYGTDEENNNWENNEEDNDDIEITKSRVMVTPMGDRKSVV